MISDGFICGVGFSPALACGGLEPACCARQIFATVGLKPWRLKPWSVKPCRLKPTPLFLLDSQCMIVYTGPLDDSRALVQFVRRESANMRALRKLIVSREKTFVRDVNGDTMEFPGLTYGCEALDVLLEELGVIFTHATLHNPDV